eukprot:3326117-Ditylum_brightwellii.AAC.1
MQLSTKNLVENPYQKLKQYLCNQVKKQDRDLRITDRNLIHHHLVNLVLHKNNLEQSIKKKISNVMLQNDK